MELVKIDSIYFDELTHSYLMGNKVLMGVTSLMKKHGLSANYENVPQDVLERAAARGSAIHKAIEEYCQNPKAVKAKDLTEEVKQFKSLKLKVIANEYLISDNEIVASSIDIVLDDFSLADIKTTATLHIEPLTWQLSIYAYLFEKQTGHKVPALYGIHIRNGVAKKVEVGRIPDSEIERLLQCEREGVLFTALPTVQEQSDEMQKIYQLQQFIVDIETKAKKAKEDLETLKAKLYEQMEQKDIKTIDNDLMKITRILPTTRVGVDSKKLQEKYPDVYPQVIKETQVKGAIKITIK